MKALRIYITIIGLGLVLFSLIGCASMNTQPHGYSYDVVTALGTTACRVSLLGCSF
jgi:hypothetical protein